MVAEYEGRVVGFMIYELQRPGSMCSTSPWTATSPLGVGSQMMAKLIAKLSLQRRNRIQLEVRETNLAAQLFFRATDFGRFGAAGLYEDTPEDAYTMQYRYPGRPRRDRPQRASRAADDGLSPNWGSGFGVC